MKDQRFHSRTSRETSNTRVGIYTCATNLMLLNCNTKSLVSLKLNAVPHIKRLQEDKVKHNSALLLLNHICEEVGTLHSSDDIYEHYCDAFNLAVENDTPEAVEAIVECFPEAIWSKINDYYLSQLAITNRCEKVYNFLVHQVDDKHLQRTSTDNDGNNLLHLAAQIAPIHKLNIVSGAALQMQRELQWLLGFIRHTHTITQSNKPKARKKEHERFYVVHTTGVIVLVHGGN
ncbi:hypothetical protein OSB04_012953 [Centaurea solstitialis]|uniref:Uncharacterized protein n=1 Tax=Centaurea solstitialis TaxID=347529 RepID=A0AA38TE28_9ASTR|nr:hypothetical protein OSB04_012953 [Centaurea solstitialis]